jgi:hypothetical protein
MQKIIIRTALITVSAILFACLLICGGALLLSSRLSAEFFSNIGKEETALHFYERGYERAPNEENLLLVLHSSIIAEDSDALIEYFTILDSQRTGANDAHEEFLAAKYCVALCEKGSQDTALLAAEKYVGGYSDGCAPRALVAYALSSGDNELLGKVLLLLEDVREEKASNLSEKAVNLLNKDIQTLQNYLMQV